jgi:hypothetical protein
LDCWNVLMDAGCRMSPLKVVEAWHASQRLDRGPLTKTRPHARRHRVTIRLIQKKLSISYPSNLFITRLWSPLDANFISHFELM